MKQILTPALLVLALFLIAFIFVPRHDVPVPVIDGDFTVTLSVSVAALLDNMDLLDAEKHEFVPEGGMIFPAATVQAVEGDTAFELLRRIMREEDIQIEFRHNPVRGTTYILGVNNIYEGDAGPRSNWAYRVNGRATAAEAYELVLQDGDLVEWIFVLG
ncbi:MAG: DUF4430 domain-containing protein [Defluviitaleaceae bacterium]|nr:DUF4430 domain-containing protein [Defluviitaleaceae bacterium]